MRRKNIFVIVSPPPVQILEDVSRPIAVDHHIAFVDSTARAYPTGYYKCSSSDITIVTVNQGRVWGMEVPSGVQRQSPDISGLCLVSYPIPVNQGDNRDIRRGARLHDTTVLATGCLVSTNIQPVPVWRQTESCNL